MAFLSKISKKHSLVIMFLLAVGCGLIAYILYVSRASSYLSDDPKVENPQKLTTLM